MSEDLLKVQRHFAQIPGHESLECEVSENGQMILKVIASTATMKLLRRLRASNPDISHWAIPSGNSISEILVRELILKVTGSWAFPLDQEELCHCRAIRTSRVDQAIVIGAHHVAKIRRMTSANTACGTCLPEIEKILQFRLKS